MRALGWVYLCSLVLGFGMNAMLCGSGRGVNWTGWVERCVYLCSWGGRYIVRDADEIMGWMRWVWHT